MSIHHHRTPSRLSQEELHENFTNAHPLCPYPLTPYPTISGTDIWPPPPLETSDNPVHTTEHEAKRKATAYFMCQSSPTPSSHISSTELQRVLDSLLDQVDWLEVATKVAKNRAPSIYCNAIEKILLAHIFQLVKSEGEDDNAAQLENRNHEKNDVSISEGDKEGDEDESEFAGAKEEHGESDEDDDKGAEEYMKEDKDENDEITDDKYDESSRV